MEILKQFANPLLIAAVMAIVGIIKDRWFFAKMDTKLISVIVSVVLIAILQFISPDPELIITIENVLLIILPALGYDYLYEPVLKPVFDLFKSKKKEDGGTGEQEDTPKED